MLRAIFLKFYNLDILQKELITEEKYFKCLLLIGHIFFFILLYWSIIYYKERMLAFDTAYFCFKIIHFKNFFIEHGRYGAFFSQLFPVLAVKMNWSLKTFLIGYSVSFIIICYIFYNINVHVFKNIFAGIVLILALCLTVRSSYYFALAELIRGIAFSTVLYAWISKEKKIFNNIHKKLDFLIAGLIVFLGYFFHPLIIVPVIFVLFFELIRKKRWTDNYYLALIIFTIILFGYRYLSIQEASYEGSRLNIFNEIGHIIPNLLNAPSYLYLKNYATNELSCYKLLFIIVIGYYLIKRKFLLALLIPIFLIGFNIVLLIIHFNGASPKMYDLYYSIFGIFLAIPISYDLLKNKYRVISLIILMAILYYNLNRIWKSHHLFTQRVAYIERITNYGNKLNQKKLIINDQNIPYEIVWEDWAFAFETLLYTSIEDPYLSSTVYTNRNIDNFDPVLDKNVFLGAHFSPFYFKSEDLNNNYFKLPKTIYKKVNTSFDEYSYDLDYFTKDSIMIYPIQSTYHLNNKITTISIIIKNNSLKRLPSIYNTKYPTYLSYHIYNANDSLLILEGIRTRIEVDIVDSYSQPIKINFPSKNKEYILEIDLVSGDKRWWGINSRCKVIID